MKRIWLKIKVTNTDTISSSVFTFRLKFYHQKLFCGLQRITLENNQ